MKRNTTIKIVLAGCVIGGGVSFGALANDFPTVARAQFVQECMLLKGGENYTNLYGCSCTLDKIAEKMSYDEFVRADSYARLENMRGERGGMFRNSSDQARNVRSAFREVREEAERSCFVRQVHAKSS